MRDTQRIDRIISKISVFWKQYPDLRLGQIIENAKITSPGSKTDTFNIEDDVLEQGLDSLAKGHRGGVPDYTCPKCNWTHDYTDGTSAIWFGEKVSFCWYCCNDIFPCGKVFEARGKLWQLEDHGKHLPKLVVEVSKEKHEVVLKY